MGTPASLLLAALLWCGRTAGLPTSSSSSCNQTSLQTDCLACVATQGCMLVQWGQDSEKCQLATEDVVNDGERPELFRTEQECKAGKGEDPETTVSPANTTTTTTTETPETTVPTTTIPTTTDSGNTTTSTTTTTTTSTTTSTTTTSTTAATTTTTAPTTTTTTMQPSTPSTAAPQPQPDSRGGRFDGWSFFGGILLTLGCAAIGLVGFKYYKLRSATGGNYNRF